MSLSIGKISVFAVSAIVLSFAAFQIFSIYNSARKTLADERARLLDRNRVAFEKKILTPHLSNKIKILQNANETRDFVKFKDSYFAATGGGLMQFDENGKREKHFTVLDGLPESDLTALAVFRDKLFIGTRTKNLVTFDGEQFEKYVFNERKIQAITSFIEFDTKLFIGTFDGGLISFDGAEFVEIKAIKAINYLFKTDEKLYVGTFDNGLWIYEKDVWTQMTKTAGLPSNRVVGVAVKDKNLYVATDFGLAILEENRFRTLAVLPSLSSLILHENQLFLTKTDGKIFTFDTKLEEFSAKGNLQNSRLTTIGENIFLLSNQGIFAINGVKIKPFGDAENESLTDNFVSALAFDQRENLWIGTFRRGIDIFSTDNKKIKHLESEQMREINFLQADENTVFAATSTGLLNIKNDFSTVNLTNKENLPSNSITHFSADFIATGKGLAFRENGKFRVLTAVQDLPNNAVYCVLQNGEKLYAGTLGGLAEITENKVVRVFKDSNSNLTTNWVTALVHANERLFIGTYGGGVFELLPSGEIRSFETETGKFTVNPNAIFADNERLYIGTLAGVKILNLQTQTWQNVKNFLPSETVLSITGDSENIYFGTTNGVAQIEKSYFHEEK